MADNYLERRMDDYRAGKLAAKGHTQRRTVVHDGDLAPLKSQRIFIKVQSASSSPKAKAIISMLRSAGCRVAFTDIDHKEGNRLAQLSGTQCHPIDITDEMALKRSADLIIRRWGGIDMEITIQEDNQQ